MCFARSVHYLGACTFLKLNCIFNLTLCIRVQEKQAGRTEFAVVQDAADFKEEAEEDSQ